ncbi:MULTISPECIES: DUF4145 domain-containing protein [Streptomyces]|uniref:DUF4145 domain-containing protein n=1 Tax=Streptomyces TaxID=1883 RepID=UPI00167DF4D8|nr:DUF4145 domain-containing protein [Streptomyces griseoflavus]
MGVVRTCGWCNDRCNMKNVHTAEVGTAGWGELKRVDIVFRCDGCGHLSVATGRQELVPYSSNGSTRLVVDGPSAWFPRQVGRRVYDDVPTTIASMAIEAHQCLSIEANRAAVALARAVVEATAKDRGITTGTLEKKIDKLFEQQLIREYVKDAAHEVRFGGNEVAHGDLAAEPMDNATATEVLGLMDEILDEVFQSPARVRRRKEQRLERERRLKEGDGAGSGEVPQETPAGDVVSVTEEPPF